MKKYLFWVLILLWWFFINNINSVEAYTIPKTMVEYYKVTPYFAIDDNWVFVNNMGKALWTWVAYTTKVTLNNLSWKWPIQSDSNCNSSATNYTCMQRKLLWDNTEFFRVHFNDWSILESPIFCLAGNESDAKYNFWQSAFNPVWLNICDYTKNYLQNWSWTLDNLINIQNLTWNPKKLFTNKINMWTNTWSIIWANKYLPNSSNFSNFWQFETYNTTWNSAWEVYFFFWTGNDARWEYITIWAKYSTCQSYTNWKCDRDLSIYTPDLDQNWLWAKIYKLPTLLTWVYKNFWWFKQIIDVWINNVLSYQDSTSQDPAVSSVKLSVLWRDNFKNLIITEVYWIWRTRYRDWLDASTDVINTAGFYDVVQASFKLNYWNNNWGFILWNSPYLNDYSQNNLFNYWFNNFESTEPFFNEDFIEGNDNRYSQFKALQNLKIYEFFWTWTVDPWRTTFMTYKDGLSIASRDTLNNTSYAQTFTFTGWKHFFNRRFTSTSFKNFWDIYYVWDNNDPNIFTSWLFKIFSGWNYSWTWLIANDSNFAFVRWWWIRTDLTQIWTWNEIKLMYTNATVVAPGAPVCWTSEVEWNSVNYYNNCVNLTFWWDIDSVPMWPGTGLNNWDPACVNCWTRQAWDEIFDWTEPTNWTWDNWWWLTWENWNWTWNWWWVIPPIPPQNPAGNWYIPGYVKPTWPTINWVNKWLINEFLTWFSMAWKCMNFDFWYNEWTLYFFQNSQLFDNDYYALSPNRTENICMMIEGKWREICERWLRWVWVQASEMLIMLQNINNSSPLLYLNQINYRLEWAEFAVKWDKVFLMWVQWAPQQIVIYTKNDIEWYNVKQSINYCYNNDLNINIYDIESLINPVLCKFYSINDQVVYLFDKIEDLISIMFDFTQRENLWESSFQNTCDIWLWRTYMNRARKTMFNVIDVVAALMLFWAIIWFFIFESKRKNNV